MLRITFFALIIFLFATQSNAQMRVGFLGGLNFSTVRQDFKNPAEELSTQFKPGYNLGIFSEMPFGESNLGLHTGIFFSNRGFSVDIEKNYGSDYSGYDRSNINYFVVPLTLTFNAVGNLFVFAGPYGAIGFSGINKYDIKSSGQTQRGESYFVPFFLEADESELARNESAFNALDIGANVGVGYEVSDFIVNVSVFWGMMNLTPASINDPSFEPEDFYIANRVVSLNVIYLLHLDH